MSGKIAFIGKKLGMSTIYEGMTALPVTLIQIIPNTLLSIKSKESNGYDAVVLAGGDIVKKIKKPQKHLFDKISANYRSEIKEFRLKAHTVNSEKVDFAVDEYLMNAIVDIRGVTKGKGFQGGIKRWGFKGMNASHGVSLTHRSIGSTGNRTLPGRVFKGKKMPGQMGGKNSCVQNLIIKLVDKENNIIAVKGSVPGFENGILFITDAVKRQFNRDSLLVNNVSL
jgi:large subunit ribosomal protein L3